MLQGRRKGSALATLLVAGAVACGSGEESSRRPATDVPAGLAAVGDEFDARCALPGAPTVFVDEDGIVLQEWVFDAEDVHSTTVLPPDSGLLSYRAAVRADDAAVRQPVADAAAPSDSDEAEIWANERYNNELAMSGRVGVIEPITCLDALLFAYQNRRVPQLESPTEFLASVLRRETEGGSELIVVFGAGEEMFPPKSVYGFDVVERHLEEGWEYWYALHNHTLQRNGDRLALGTPVPSTSDVHLTRNLAADMGLQHVRVTNGFFTIDVRSDELDALRAR